jgi:hypothetical protein
MRNPTNNLIEEKVTVEWTPEEKASLPSRYGCDILIENASMEQVKDPSLPTDAYLVFYVIKGNECMDLCRGNKRSSIFDLYYDKFGKNVVTNIDWGYGRVTPRMWGYKSPEKKKRK